VKAEVARRFAGIAPRSLAIPVHTVEPVQRGERRTLLHDAVDRQHFLVAYPAPAASNADFAAFLVLQQLLAGGSGVNFRENDWGTPAVDGSLLFGLADEIATWFIPTRDRYLFTIGGSIDAAGNRAAIEQELERRLATFRPTRVGAAKSAVLGQLTADVQTTEDAAHQLAYFEGIGALDVLLGLRDRVSAVTTADLERAARSYLDPQRRTVGWLIPGAVASAPGNGAPRPAGERRGSAVEALTMPPPRAFALSGGLPVLFQENRSTDTMTVKLLLSAPLGSDDLSSDMPGFGAITRSGPAARLPELVAEAHAELAKELLSDRRFASTQSDDPETRLHQLATEIMRLEPSRGLRPVLIAVSGAVDEPSVKRILEGQFGSIQPAAIPPKTAQAPVRPTLETRRVAVDKRLSQGELGYVVPAPPPGTRESVAWRLLRYVLTHDYSGRLGRTAIMDKGLAYYIGSAYPTDGTRGWIKIWAGVDPAKADALEQEFREQLAALVTHPPSAAEVEAAKRNLLGRDISAAQSNAEIVHKLTLQFIEKGQLQSHAEFERLVMSITPAEIEKAIPAFDAGTILRVDVKR
jgi:predicted Zn-dependent peptidase